MNTYRVYTPKGYAPGQHLPLYVMVHGCNTNAAEQEGANLLDALADREHIVVLYADHDQQQDTDIGTHPARCWRFYDPTSTKRGEGDPATIAGETEAVARAWGVDRTRIYLVGMASGGMMTSNTLAAYPDVYAAAGVVAGCAYEAGAPCVAGASTDTDGEATDAYREEGSSARVTPVIAIQGDADTIVAPANNLFVVQQWLKSDNLALTGSLTTPVSLEPQTSVTVSPAGRRSYINETWHDPAGQVVAERDFIHGMGHDWPGGTDDPAYSSYTDPSAPGGADLTWDFLRHYSLVEGLTVVDGATLPPAVPTAPATSPSAPAAAAALPDETGSRSAVARAQLPARPVGALAFTGGDPWQPIMGAVLVSLGAAGLWFRRGRLANQQRSEVCLRRCHPRS